MISNDNIEIGKYTLESLTTGMYSNPKIIYREYIQNSVDSLELAVSKKIIEQQNMRIDILIDIESSSITISDNGTGISYYEARPTLMNIGNSSKRHTHNRGFRGIGRLGGMSYCNTLIFSTSYKGENKKTVITFDCKRLRELLVPGSYEKYNLSSVLNEITTVEYYDEKEEAHFFSVELKEVSDFSGLLNIDDVRIYISQVAPLPYLAKKFVRSSELYSFLGSKGYVPEEFPIFVGENEYNLVQIFKPNRHRFHSDRSKKRIDEILDMEFFEVFIDDEIYALGWYANCEWLGTISDNALSGIRVRKGNILIGDSKTLNGIFKESRFNGWVQGELFVLTDKLIPNARRDDFEQNEDYFKLIRVLSENIGSKIAKTIREASLLRNDNSVKVIHEAEKQIRDVEKVLNEGFNSSTDKEKIIENLVSTEEVLKKSRTRDDLKPSKDLVIKKIEETISNVKDSRNFKINKVNTGIDRKSKKILNTVSDILSKKLSKFLVDEIIEEIIKELNGE